MQVPRVKNTTSVTTSTNPTTPAFICNAPRFHLKNMQNNTPIPIVAQTVTEVNEPIVESETTAIPTIQQNTPKVPLNPFPPVIT